MDLTNFDESVLKQSHLIAYESEQNKRKELYPSLFQVDNPKESGQGDFETGIELRILETSLIKNQSYYTRPLSKSNRQDKFAELEALREAMRKQRLKDK